jgi:hypothetical protein
MCQEPCQTVDSLAKLLNQQILWRLTAVLLQNQTGHPEGQANVGHAYGSTDHISDH